MKRVVTSGFTLIEILIVVAIIGIVAAIAVPYYLQFGWRSQRATCISNLRTLDHAIQQVRLEGEGGAVSMNMLCAPIGYIRGVPHCPADASKDYDLTSDLPGCPNVAQHPEHFIK